eukprot:TRINITY_DN12991_c0_g1_i1.p1 TRINITY_DN12991_c0_g1~~TRINITY_DN12991_c0_g1_i1.p1  ORF type:complete len:345 (+),score=43.64 TRINITY_DN12991_c0_g1_i1:77-1111(+)
MCIRDRQQQNQILSQDSILVSMINNKIEKKANSYDSLVDCQINLSSNHSSTYQSNSIYQVEELSTEDSQFINRKQGFVSKESNSQMTISKKSTSNSTEHTFSHNNTHNNGGTSSNKLLDNSYQLSESNSKTNLEKTHQIQKNLVQSARQKEIKNGENIKVNQENFFPYFLTTINSLEKNILQFLHSPYDFQSINQSKNMLELSKVEHFDDLLRLQRALSCTNIEPIRQQFILKDLFQLFKKTECTLEVNKDSQSNFLKLSVIIKKYAWLFGMIEIVLDNSVINLVKCSCFEEIQKNLPNFDSIQSIISFLHRYQMEKYRFGCNSNVSQPNTQVDNNNLDVNIKN